MTLDDHGCTHFGCFFFKNTAIAKNLWMFDPITADQCFTYVVVGPRGRPLRWLHNLCKKTPLMFNIDPTLPKRKPDRLPSIMNFRVELLNFGGYTSQKPMVSTSLKLPQVSHNRLSAAQKAGGLKKPRDVEGSPPRRAARRCFFVFFGQTAHAPEKRQQACQPTNKESCNVRSASCFACFERGLIV